MHGAVNTHEIHVSCGEFLDKLEIYQREREADVAKCKRLFAEFDADNSGYLDRSEVKQLAQHMGLSVHLQNPAFLDQMISDIENARIKLGGATEEDDGETDGQVELAELLPWFLETGRSYLPKPVYPNVQPVSENPSQEELHELFVKIDADGSGQVHTWYTCDRPVSSILRLTFSCFRLILRKLGTGLCHSGQL